MIEVTESTQLYPSLHSLSRQVQKRVIGKATYLTHLEFGEEKIFEEPEIPEDTEKRKIYLTLVSQRASSLRGKYPAQTYKFLKKVWRMIQGSTELSKTTEYCEFLGEFLACANWNADIMSGELICQEAGVLIERHLQYVYNHQKTSRILYKYRGPLVNTVITIAYYYSRRGDLENARKYATLGQKLSAVFCTAHRRFDLLMLEIQILLRETPRNDDVLTRLFEEAEKVGLPSLLAVYSQNNNLTHFSSAQREYGLLRFQYESTIADLTNGTTLATRLTKWRALKDHYDANEKEYDQSDRQILFQIEIMMYIAIEKYLRNTNHADPIGGVDIDIEEEGTNQNIQEHHYRIDTSGLDVDNTVKQDNGGLFLGSLVDLFAYRIESLPNEEVGAKVSYARAVSVSHALHMMLDIYQTALGKGEGNPRELTKTFKTRTFFSRYMESCHILMTSIHACSADATDDDILQGLYKLIGHRDGLEKDHIAHVISGIKDTQKINILKIKKVHLISPNDSEKYYMEEEYTIGDGEGTHWKLFEYNKTQYMIYLSSEGGGGDIDAKKIDTCITKIFSLMPSIIRGGRKIVNQEDTSGGSASENNIFRNVITKMGQLGIPRDGGDFFKSVLDPDSIAQRTRIDQVGKSDLLGAKGVPIIITMSDNEPAISVVNVGEIDGCTNLAVRFGIIGANISHNLPPYDGICIVRVLPDGSWSRQGVRCNPKDINGGDNKNQSLYEQQIESLGTILGNRADGMPGLPCIHHGKLGQIYELGEVTTEQRFIVGQDNAELTSKVTKRNFLVQILAYGVNTQLIISSYRDDETGKYIMYISSMVTSGEVNIVLISKWFSTVLFDESLVDTFTGIPKFIQFDASTWTFRKDDTIKTKFQGVQALTLIIWERNDSYTGKLPKRIPLETWHKLNTRWCNVDTVDLDGIEGRTVGEYYSHFVIQAYWHLFISPFNLENTFDSQPFDLVQNRAIWSSNNGALLRAPGNNAVQGVGDSRPYLCCNGMVVYNTNPDPGSDYIVSGNIPYGFSHNTAIESITIK